MVLARPIGSSWGALLALACFSVAGRARADAPDAVWSALKERDVVVVKEDGEKVAGKLIGVEPTSVVVMLRDGEPLAIDRSEVRSVRGGGAKGASRPADEGGDEPGDEGSESASTAARSRLSAAKKLIGKPVIVKLRGGREVRGELAEINDDEVIVIDGTGAPVEVHREHVKSIKKLRGELRAAEPATGLVHVTIEADDPLVQLYQGSRLVCTNPCDTDVDGRLGEPFHLARDGASMGPKFVLKDEPGPVVLHAKVEKPPKTGEKIAGGVLTGVGGVGLVGGIIALVILAEAPQPMEETYAVIYGAQVGVGAVLAAVGIGLVVHGLGDYEVQVPHVVEGRSEQPRLRMHLGASGAGFAF